MSNTAWRARHIDLLRRVADLAEEHDLPLPMIYRPVSDTAPARLVLPNPDQESGPMWAHLLQLGTGSACIGSTTYVASWQTSEVALRSFCDDAAQAERLVATDVLTNG